MKNDAWFEKLAAENSRRVERAKRRGKKQQRKPTKRSADESHFPDGAYEEMKRLGIV